MQNNTIFIVIFSLVLIIPLTPVEASSNPNLFVSAENPKFNNHFSGSQVVEVLIRDNNIRDTDEGKGEPDVTINGKTLRMVQATDGNWYAYFANLDKTQIADDTVGSPGTGLDFGIFCNRNDGPSVGISLSDTDGFFVPRDTTCGAPPAGSTNLNNVVRNARSINTNSNVPSGQIGLDEIAWPLIQLYSFSDVTIQYNAAGGTQIVDLEYNDIPNISLNLDRDAYPPSSEVFVTVNDFQLNQDPTDEDSWTFNIKSPVATFYQAFDNNGNESAAGNAGLVNLLTHLSNLGFENNGALSMDLGSVLELKPNNDQGNVPTINDDSTSYSQIITLVENGPNSGVFESFDSSDQSTIGIQNNAPRGQTGRIEYNEQSVSVLTGLSTASVSLEEAELKVGDKSQPLSPGTKIPITLVDSDQNTNSGTRDNLDLFRVSTILPTLEIGNPITLESLQSATLANQNLQIVEVDRVSKRAILRTTNDITVADGDSLRLVLKVPFSDLYRIIQEPGTTNFQGVDLVNFDLRSIANAVKASSVSLSVGDSVSTSVVVDGANAQDLINLADNAIANNFFEKKLTANVILDFNLNNSGQLIPKDTSMPVVVDFFSFGLSGNKDVNNAIYRFELEETSDNSSIFEGSLEYVIPNQLTVLDADFIQTIRPIGDKIKFIVTNRLVDEEGIFISYSDLNKVGVITTTSTTSRSDINTHSGVVSTGSNSYRFGQPVTIVLNDPDLNLKSDIVDVYSVIDDPNSINVDTAGGNGQVLLEILIKDVRYKRCTINGVDYGGLASTGFAMIETAPNTGIFAGVFKMPSQICNKSGTQLISPAGGSIEVKYYDSRDASGNSNVFDLQNNKQIQSSSTNAQLSDTEIDLPLKGKSNDVILSGIIANHKKGLPLSIILTHPDGTLQNFAATISNSGNYRAAFSIHSNSLLGTYNIQLSHNGIDAGFVSFNVVPKSIPDWIKNDVKQWSSASISNSEFIDVLKQMIEDGIIIVSPTKNPVYETMIPEWVRNNAQWLSNGQISDNDFINSIQYLVTKGVIRV
jgi:hypothetical protein